LAPQAQEPALSFACTRLGAAIFCGALLAGCAKGIDLDRMGIDRTIVTSSTTSTAQDEAASDEAAIRAAISSWVPGTPLPEAMPWVNIATGSSGAIQSISDTIDADGACRTFNASRESFDGVGLYRGRACSNGGVWRVTSLDKS